MTRLPDFLIIGAMKAGTTSLYRWLESTGAADVPATKEPHFFTQEWERGLDWYTRLFSEFAPDRITGEASVSYTDPKFVELAAERIHLTVPRARLIFLARNPLTRLRSHYRHEVQRNRERRSFIEAISEPDSSYVRCSLYSQALAPYLHRFDPEQLLVVEFDHLVNDRGFGEVLRHLGLEPRPRPGDDYNLTDQKPRYTPAARWLFEKGLTTPLSRLPRPIRQLGRALGTKTDHAYVSRLEESRIDPIPGPIRQLLAADISKLEDLLQRRFEWVTDD